MIWDVTYGSFRYRLFDSITLTILCKPGLFSFLEIGDQNNTFPGLIMFFGLVDNFIYGVAMHVVTGKLYLHFY